MGSLHLIGGEKGGVGKSVVARLVAQYLIDENIPFVGYDTDRSHATFARFYQDYASPVVLDSYTSVDQIAEGLIADPTKHAVVDLAAQSLRPLTQWITDSGLVEVLGESGLGLTYWHVMDDSKDSLATLGTLLKTFGSTVRYVIVLNHGRGSSFAPVLASAELAEAKSYGAAVLTLPKLHEVSMHKIDVSDASFWAAVNLSGLGEATLGLLERHRVRVWLKAFGAELDQVLGQKRA